MTVYKPLSDEALSKILWYVQLTPPESDKILEQLRRANALAAAVKHCKAFDALPVDAFERLGGIAEMHKLLRIEEEALAAYLGD